MSRKTKKEKLEELHRLIKKAFPGEEPVDFSKVYKSRKGLSGPLSRLIDDFINYEDFTLPLLSLRYIPQYWIEQNDLSSDDWTVADNSIFEHEEFFLIKGKDVVKMLDQLKRELGSKPNDALVLVSGEDDFEVVTIGDISVKDLNHCLKEIKVIIDQRDRDRLRFEAIAKEQTQQEVIQELVRRVGYETAVEALTKIDKRISK